MTVIVTCSCRAQIRVPEEGLSKTFRCPLCRTEFVATEGAQMVKFTRSAEMAAGTTCPTCQGPVGPGELALSCPACQQVHHRECWVEVGGCSTYGCPQAPVLTKGEAAGPPLSAWGDTKTCPACGERIKSIALRCRYCGTDFDTVDPQTVSDLGKHARKKETSKTLQNQLITLFICSLFGCIAPVMLLIGLIWFLPRRKEAARAGSLYAVLGYTSITIASIFTLLIVFFLVYSP